MQKITPEIRAALDKLYKSGVSRPWIAQRCGVSSSVVYAWMTHAEKIREANWRRLYPLIAKYLPDMPEPEPLPTAGGDPGDPLLTELLTHWPRLTRGEQAKVVALAIDLLEKKGSAVQPEVLDRGVVGK